MKKNILQKKINTYVNTAKGLKGRTKTVSGNISKSLLMVLPVTGAFVSLPTTQAIGQLTNWPVLNVGNFSSSGSHGIISGTVGGKNLDLDLKIDSSFMLFNPIGTELQIYALANGQVQRLLSSNSVKAGNSSATLWDNIGNNIITSSTGNTGQFKNDNGSTDVFVGLRINTGSGYHYGFLKLRVTSGSQGGPKVQVIEGKYESTINTAVALPVELTTFSAIAQNTTIHLNWATASEENNAGFEIQRSTDGENFTTLDFIEGNGTTIEAQEYFYDDKALKTGQSYYYRLKQIDYDGQFEFSHIITATLEGDKAQVSDFYPNPTNGNTQIDYTATQGGNLVVNIYNTTGQELLRTEQNVLEGENTLNFDFSALPKGNYFVKLQAGEDVQYQKLVIQ